ncbi:MAG TPA: FAD-dependent oxidoreductase [Burkholderiales bacterium]|nr:FAD-dependent oxidoreductase [Burkholderiales bacterium]
MSLRRRRDIWDVVVVGGGIGGLTAAWYTARHGLPTAVIEAEGLLGGQVATVNELDDWPSTREESGVELASAMRTKLEMNSVEIAHEPVIEVKRDGELTLVRTAERTFRTRRVVAASGAKLRELPAAGTDKFKGKGVSQCAHCDGYFFRNQDVVVVGGGDSALQEALVLAKLAKSVTIVVRSKLRAKRAYVERAASAANVTFVWDAEVDAVIGNGAVSGVRLRRKTGEKSEIACSGVFPFIGVEPNTSYLPSSVRRDDGGRVITDERMRTGEPSIFAIGAVRSGFSGELTGAAGEAAIAAATIAADLAR